jgi:hypothetical protein
MPRFRLNAEPSADGMTARVQSIVLSALPSIGFDLAARVPYPLRRTSGTHEQNEEGTAGYEGQFANQRSERQRGSRDVSAGTGQH